MGQYLKIYKDNPTANGIDGTAVSEGDNSFAISAKVNYTTKPISDVITLAIRTIAINSKNFRTDDITVITLESTTGIQNNWRLSLDGVTWAEWGASITLPAGIANINKLFYLQARAIETDTAQNDKTVSLCHRCNSIIEV